MRRCISSFTLVLSAAAAPLWAQPAAATTIDHQGVACIIAGKYPKLVACLGSEITGGKAWFQAQDDPAWYWVNKSDQKAPPETVQPNLVCSVWVLPRPGRKLVNKHIEYYIEVGSSRTGEFDPLVVRRALECKKNAPVAPTSPTGPAGVFPAMAPGFVGNFPTAAVVTTAAVGGGLAALLASGGDNAVTPPPPGAPPAAPAPPPPTPPTPEPPSVSPLALSCQASPRSGEAPLKVSFAGFPSGGTGSYDFRWTFGDGGTSNGKQPTHTYTSPGSYDATLNVTSGDQVRQCSRGITVNRPPAERFQLTVNRTGTGSGSVTDDHGKIDCGLDCTATYVSGTQVALTPKAAPASVFAGWSGACSGTGSCVVTTDGNKSVTARFDLAPTPPPPPARVTLTFTSILGVSEFQFQRLPPDTSASGTITPTVNIDPPNEFCNAEDPPGNTCTHSYSRGTTVTLVASADTGLYQYACWDGACFGSEEFLDPTATCTLTMTSNLTASATFQWCPCEECDPRAKTAPSGAPVWAVQLDAPGAIGQVVLGNQLVVLEAGRRSEVRARSQSRDGDEAVEAQLVKAEGKPGLWRFEAQADGTIEPGSLRVLRGEVALVTPTAIVFRLAGTAGEQVAFSYRLRR